MSVPYREYELHTEWRDEYLFARVTAKALDRAGVLDYLSEVADAAASRQTLRVLLDRRVGNTLSESETLFVVTKLAKMRPGLKLAIVNENAAQMPVMEFASDIGRHAGQIYHAFGDEGSGVKWLLTDESPDYDPDRLKISDEERELAELEKKRLNAEDLIAHLERMRPGIQNNPGAYSKWQSMLEEATERKRRTGN